MKRVEKQAGSKNSSTREGESCVLMEDGSVREHEHVRGTLVVLNSW